MLKKQYNYFVSLIHHMIREFLSYIIGLFTTKEDAENNCDPPQIVVATFTFVEGKKAEFLELLHGPEGLQLTREFEGCISIDCYDDQDDENSLVLIQEWDSRENHENYLNMRKDTGMFDLLDDMLAVPLKPVYLTPVDV